jgi:hypothetical protein
LLSTVIAGAVEMGGGLMWAAWHRVTAGTAHAMVVGSDLGLLAMWAAAIMINAGTSFPNQLHSGMALAGAVAGGVGGAIYGRLHGFNWGDAEFFWLSALLGAYVTIPAIAWGALVDPRAVSGIVLAGLIGGGAAGYFLLGDKHLDVGQAVLIDIGTMAGGLLGMGLVTIAGGFGDWRIPFTVSALAAVGGYAVTYLTLVPQGSPGAKNRTASMHMQFNPVALVAPSPEAKRAPIVSMMGTF